MTGFGTALAVEGRKAWASWTLRVTGLLVALGIPAVVGAIVAAARGGGTAEARAQLLAKLGPDVVAANWHALVLASAEVTAAASVLAFGVAAAWLVGREFVDGTVPALFGLPVGRAAVASAKLLVHLCWALLVALLLVVVLVVVGLVLGLGRPEAATVAGLARIVVLAVLTALVSLAAAVAATLARSVLAGVAVAVVTIVTAQIWVFAGGGVWFPLASPALWAMHPGGVPVGALGVVVLFGATCAVVTVQAWRRLQLVR